MTISVVRPRSATIVAGELHDRRRDLGVERGRVLVEQQQAGLGDGGHEQRHRLPLAAGELVDAGLEAALEAHAEARELDRASPRAACW